MKILYTIRTEPYYYEFTEEFKDINCYEVKSNMYQISNKGRVINKISGNELKIIHDEFGYRYVGLQLYDNERIIPPIHRLVAITFIPKTQEDILLNRDFVNHKNLLKWDNRFINLEWTTPMENTQHYLESIKALGLPLSHKFLNPIKMINDENPNNWSNGTVTQGEANGMSRLTEEQVRKICEGLCHGLSYSECAVYANLENTENDRFLISSIAQRRKWTHISKDYDFPTARTIMNYDEYVIPVCELLQQGITSPTQISKLLNMPGTYDQIRGFIGRLRRKETYTEISNMYF